MHLTLRGSLPFPRSVVPASKAQHQRYDVIWQSTGANRHLIPYLADAALYPSLSSAPLLFSWDLSSRIGHDDDTQRQSHTGGRAISGSEQDDRHEMAQS